MGNLCSTKENDSLLVLRTYVRTTLDIRLYHVVGDRFPIGWIFDVYDGWKKVSLLEMYEWYMRTLNLRTYISRYK